MKAWICFFCTDFVALKQCMALTRSQKEAFVRRISQEAKSASNILLLDFSGLNVQEVSLLRREVKKEGCVAMVARNSLIRLGLAERFKDGGVDESELSKFFERLKNSTMVVFTKLDPIKPVRVIFEKLDELKGKFSIKAAFFEAKAFLGKDLESLKNYPSREESLAKLLQLLNSPAQRLLALLNRPAQNVLTALDQISKRASQ